MPDAVTVESESEDTVVPVDADVASVADEYDDADGVGDADADADVDTDADVLTSSEPPLSNIGRWRTDLSGL